MEIGNRFQIKRFLAKGGMGAVYIAYDTHLEKNVIVKTSEKQELVQEAKMLNRLRHPAFPAILDFYQEEKYLLVMEYVDGVTLKEYLLQNGPLTEQQALHIGVQLAEALAYLHNLRPSVIYQDLKPENVMLQKDGVVRLIDLGAAVALQGKYGRNLFSERGIMGQAGLFDGKRTNGEAYPFMAMGTKGYAAPEQEKGAVQEIDVQSDIYAFGGVLYSMVTGIFLNMPPYIVDPVEQICPELSAMMCHVIEKAMEKEKKNRFSNLEEILQLWKRGNSLGKKCCKRNKQKRPYLRREKSVFLSAKQFAGLWVCVLFSVLSLTLGYGQVQCGEGRDTGRKKAGNIKVGSGVTGISKAGSFWAVSSLVHEKTYVVYLDLCE